MISQDLRALAARFVRTTNIIWFAFLGAPVLYAVVAWFVFDSRSDAFETSLPPEALYVLVAIAVVSGPVFSWGIAPLVASPAKIVAQGGNTQLLTDFGEDQPRYERLSETEKKRAQMLGAIQTAHIVRWAGAESVAIYGLLGLFTGVGTLYAAWGFIVASVILLLLLRPDYETELDKITP